MTGSDLLVLADQRLVLALETLNLFIRLFYVVQLLLNFHVPFCLLDREVMSRLRLAHLHLFSFLLSFLYLDSSAFPDFFQLDLVNSLRGLEKLLLLL